MTNLCVGAVQALLGLGLMALGVSQGAERRVEVALNEAGSLAVSEVVSALAESTGQTVKPPPTDVTLPVRGPRWGVPTERRRGRTATCCSGGPRLRCCSARLPGSGLSRLLSG